MKEFRKKQLNIQGYKLSALQQGALNQSSETWAAYLDIPVIFYFINSSSVLSQVLENFSFVTFLCLSLCIRKMEIALLPTGVL